MTSKTEERDSVPKLGTIVPKLGTSAQNPSPATALFGRTRRTVLALMYGHPDDSFYVRQIVRAVGSGRGAVERELRRLTAAGILTRSTRGRQVHYQANRACPIFDELQRLLVKTVGVADVLKSALSPFSDRVELAFVYGSVVDGRLGADSDVDVIVVGAVTFAEVVSAFRPVHETLGREVNPSVYPPAEFRNRVVHGDHFITSVLRGPKIFLVGGERELAGLGEVRLAD